MFEFVLPWLSWPLVLLYIVAAYLIYMCWHFPLWYRQGIVVAGTPIPILGTMGKTMRTGLIEGIQGDLEKYGQTHGAFGGRAPTLTTIDPEILKEIFKDIHTFPERFNFASGDPIDDAMLSNINDIDHWKAVRITMSPAFSSGKLKRMMKQINKCAATYAQHLARESEGGKSLEMKEFAGSFAMDAIASTAFGLDVNSQTDRNNPFVKHANAAFNISLMHPALLIGLFCPCLKPLVRKFKVGFIDKQARAFFEDIVNQVLDSRKDGDEGTTDFVKLLSEAHKEEDGEEDEKDNPGKKRALTRTEVVAQAILFFMAGYDTVASTVSFLAYNLACNQEKQDKVIDEIHRVIADKSSGVTDDDLHNMPFLDQCVSETLRLFPPAVRLERIAHRDVVLKGNIFIPKGGFVMCPVYHMHRFAEIYPEPDNFIPERFSPEEKAKRNPLHYAPFGHGPRACIASRLALMEVKLAIAHVLLTHRFVPAPETCIPARLFKGGGLIKMENGNWLRLEKHNKE